MEFSSARGMSGEVYSLVLINFDALIVPWQLQIISFVLMRLVNKHTCFKMVRNSVSNRNSHAFLCSTKKINIFRFYILELKALKGSK